MISPQVIALKTQNVQDFKSLGYLCINPKMHKLESIRKSIHACEKPIHLNYNNLKVEF